MEAKNKQTKEKKMNTYNVLKNIAIEAGIGMSKDQLEILIMKFKNEINTPRRRECIRTVRDLIAYLQRCDALSQQNISALCAVADITSSRELQLAIANYEPPKTHTNVNVNQYSLQRLGYDIKQQERQEINSSNHDKNIGIITITEDKLTAVNNLISQEIGNYWRRLGRELGINEATMDQIEIICPRDLSSRTMRILLIIQKQYKHNLGQYMNILCQALVTCQRRDLRRRIETLLVNYS